MRTHAKTTASAPTHIPSCHLPVLSVRLLVPRTCPGTAELLGLAPPIVGDEERAVVGDEGLLELVLAVFVDVFLVVGDLHSIVSGLMIRFSCV